MSTVVPLGNSTLPKENNFGLGKYCVNIGSTGNLQAWYMVRIDCILSFCNLFIYSTPVWKGKERNAGVLRTWWW